MANDYHIIRKTLAAGSCVLSILCWSFRSRLASLRMQSDSWPSIWMLIIRCIHHCHSLSICGFLDFDKFWSFTICFWTSGDDACGRKRDRGHSPPWNFSSALLQKHIWSKANQNPANKLFYFMWAHSQILIWVGNCHAVHVCNLLIHVILVLYVWVYSWHFAPVVWANFKCFSTVQESLHW